MKRSFEKKHFLGCAEARINKQTEYTKEFMKEIPIGKCTETGDKYNSVIRTIGEN